MKLIIESDGKYISGKFGDTPLNQVKLSDGKIPVKTLNSIVELFAIHSIEIGDGGGIIVNRKPEDDFVIDPKSIKIEFDICA